MRTRKEIIKELENSIEIRTTIDSVIAEIIDTHTEILLDIRDLLLKETK